MLPLAAAPGNEHTAPPIQVPLPPVGWSIGGFTASIGVIITIAADDTAHTIAGATLVLAAATALLLNRRISFRINRAVDHIISGLAADDQ
ncbi:hypothetical protein ACIRCZ_19700 [Leifsonia sp. NPDC102414]|uniref:hypothetical protein n=1 Tax=Leifsonia sp. NPDC102414 TaxID=3364124 RepID=UPI00382169FA